ncbi:helix-turn-helix domain-containing protein [Promicromonospora iranensis]|uniref:helix-turn-helix domain-containing protein n=1 Tax=Promicromonospora iranensis TaxID=1105144 RepID=UPI0023A99FE9|nr:helix-turn-helix domain-containing protein [Promicromonospora iranensis]
MSDQKIFGARVAALRKERKLSQKDLGAELGRSESWVSQVERGVLPVDRLSTLQTLADALEVSVLDLRSDAAEPPEDGPAEPGSDLDSIRLALTGYPGIATLLEDSAPADERPIDELREHVDRLWELAHASAFSEIGEELVTLIPMLERRVRRSAATDAEHEVLAQVYQVTAAVLARQDEADAAWVASDRAIAAAGRSGQPLEVVAGTFRLAHTFLRVQRPEQAEYAASEAIRALQPKLDDGSLSTEGKSLYGALQLVRAVISSREGDRTATHRWLDQARAVAGDVGPGRSDFGTEFGPANVEIHAVTASVDLGDAGMALDLAEQIDTSELSAERRSRLLLDKARAYTQRRQVGEAVAALLEAEELAPEQIRAHPLARQAIRDLMQISRRTPVDLQELAHRATVA